MKLCQGCAWVVGVAIAWAQITQAGETRVFTNEDLVSSRGYLTFSEPSSLEEGEALRPEAPVHPKGVEKLRSRYRALRRRAERIEERDLPRAREAAARRKSESRRPSKRISQGDSKNDAGIAKIERELEGLRDEMLDIERQAHRLGLSTVGLMRD